MKVFVSDSRAENKETWELGTIHVWFKNGLDEGNNQGIAEEYRSHDLITHVFPPEEQPRNPIVRISYILTF